MELLLTLLEGSSSFFLTLGIGGVCAALLFLKYRYDVGSEQPRDIRNNTGKLCEIPSCVRCSNNSKLNLLAQQNFQRYTRSFSGDLRRIGDAIGESLTKTNNSNPAHLFDISSLRSQSVWKLEDLPESYQQDYRILKESIISSTMISSKTAQQTHNRQDGRKSSSSIKECRFHINTKRPLKSSTS